MHPRNPACQVFRVTDGGRKSYQLYVWRRTDDGFFPDRASPHVTQVMHFIEDHKTDVLYTLARQAIIASFLQEHIAIHLGCHDDNRGVAMLDDIAGHQSDCVETI